MKDYQQESLKKYRNKKVFSLFGFIITNGVIIRTGKYFKYVEIIEEKVKVRYLDFDDGWTYKFFWTKWEEKWIFNKIKK